MTAARRTARMDAALAKALSLRLCEQVEGYDAMENEMFDKK